MNFKFESMDSPGGVMTYHFKNEDNSYHEQGNGFKPNAKGLYSTNNSMLHSLFPILMKKLLLAENIVCNG